MYWYFFIYFVIGSDSGIANVGKSQTGITNENGSEFVEFADRNNLKFANTFFNKKPRQKLTRKSPDYHPYRLQIVQGLKKIDLAWWKDFYEQFLHLQLPEDMELFLVTRYTSNWIGM